MNSLRPLREQKMANKKQTVVIQCKGEKNIPINELRFLQGDLKKLPGLEYGKLKNEILELGFSEPVSIWQDKDKYYILNGHQRIAALLKMQKEGIIIPKTIPVATIEAKDIKEAKMKLLALTSQYGRATDEGLRLFMNDAGLTAKDIEGRFALGDIVVTDAAIDAETGPGLGERPEQAGYSLIFYFQEEGNIEKLQKLLDFEGNKLEGKKITEALGL